MLSAIFKYGITGLFLLIDGIVYFVLANLFDIFNSLAKSQIFSNEFIDTVATKAYVIIGIFMLFVVAYSLLKALVNPDNVKDVGKIVKNIIISLILLSVVPLIFNYARELQKIIIEDNIIGNLILNEGDSVNFQQEGRNISLTMLETFLQVPEDATADGNYPLFALTPSVIASGTIWGIAYKAFSAITFLENMGEKPTWKELTTAIRNGEYGNFLKIGLWGDTVASSDEATYIPIVSTICGAFLIYVLISFCLDLGVRVIKLGFYQIIAPIPILMLIVPNKKNVFDNWVKATVATYLEVFVRIFIMVLSVFIVSKIIDGTMIEVSSDIGLFGLIVLILGIFAFAKQAPKLISNVTGIDSGNLKLGIGGKLDASGPLGKAINYVGKGTFGALTGGLGGMYGAAINGASGGAGFLYGAINGWKGKKGQFNKQRQDVYSNVFDQKGSAGWFGGRGIIDSTKEKGKDALKASYLESETAKVQKVENSAEFQRRVQEETNRQKTENSQKYNELAQQLSEKIQELEKNKMDRIKELMETKRQEELAFEKSKLQKLHDLQIELDDARDKKDMARQVHLLNQLTATENSSYSNTNLENQISIEQAKTSTAEIDDIRNEMRKVSTVDENAIFKATQKEFQSANAKYKTSSKYVAQKAAEKAAKQWREEHADEAIAQETIMKNALESLQKGGSPAGFGGKTGGPGSSSSGGSSGSSKTS